MNQLTTFIHQLQALTVFYLPRVLLAGLALVVGWWAIGRASQLLGWATAHLDVSLSSFLRSLANIVLKVLLLVSVAGMVGVQTTSFVALLGAAGLAVGLALQGTLANFAGGVLILMLKPYAVGDIIEAQGKIGKVVEIFIFNTILITPQGDTVILPNGATSNNVIVNKTVQNKALVDIATELEALTDLAALRTWAEPLLAADAAVLPVPAPQVVVTALRPGSLTVSFQAYTLAEHAVPAKDRLTEALQLAFAVHSVHAPVPVSRSYVSPLPA